MVEGLIRFRDASVGGFVGVYYIFLIKIQFGNSNGNALCTIQVGKVTNNKCEPDNCHWLTARCGKAHMSFHCGSKS